MTERRQVQMLDRRMFTGSVTVGLHPEVIARIQVDRGDPAIRRLEEGQTARACDEFAGTVNVPQIGLHSVTGNQVCRKGSRDRRHIQNSRFRIQRGSIPVGATDRTW